jgi:chromosome partitioning protein
MASVICVSNEKGGVGKSVTSANLSVGLSRQGKKVLVIDADPQGSLTISLGNQQPEKLPITMATVMSNILSETPFNPLDGIIHHSEGIDLMPASIALANTEIALVQAFGREAILKQYIDLVRDEYSHIIIDTSPSLGLLTINALAAANSIIVPVVPKYLDVKGLELLLKTVSKVRKQINSGLAIGGILFTMVTARYNFTKDIIAMIEQAYGGNIHIFKEYIPHSIRAAETSAEGVSIFRHDPRGKVAAAYESLVREVLGLA